MAYEPDTSLFHTSEEIKDALEFMSNTVEECINYGTYLAGWLHETTSKNEHDFPIYSTFLHFLDCLDSIKLLIQQGQSSGVKTLSRALFEASLSFRYLISSSREKGVLAYQVSLTRKKMSQRKLLDSKEDKGAIFLEKFEKQMGIKLHSQDSEIMNQHLKAYLDRSDISPINKEWKKTKKKLKHVPNWYSLFDGPENLKELAEFFDEEIMYELLYSNLSQHIHASDTTNHIRVVQQNNDIPVAISHGLRNPESLQDSVKWVLMIVIGTYTTLFDQFYPNRKKRYSNWYSSHLRRQFQIITSSELFTIHYESKN